MPGWVQSFDVYLEVPESDIVISGYDIEFNVRKTADIEADYADIIIWNLTEDIYKQLILKNQLIYLYTKFGSEESKLLFTGYLDKNHITRKRTAVVKTNNESAPPDVVTSIKLVESRTAYDNSYINIDYREDVSAEQIINDCILALGLGNVIINSEIPEKIYSTYKAKGKPHCILAQICESLELDVLIQGGIVIIGTQELNHSEEDIMGFNLMNALEPQYQNSDEALIICSYTPEVLPNNSIRCDFSDLSGVFRVLEVVSSGNNFDTAGTTNIIIGLNQ